MAADYPSNLWGTYHQWQDKGCQVRKGEKSSLVIFYRSYEVEAVNEQTGETEAADRLVARASRVFNAAQVDGFEILTEDLPDDFTYVVWHRFFSKLVLYHCIAALFMLILVDALQHRDCPHCSKCHDSTVKA